MALLVCARACGVCVCVCVHSCMYIHFFTYAHILARKARKYHTCTYQSVRAERMPRNMAWGWTCIQIWREEFHILHARACKHIYMFHLYASYFKSCRIYYQWWWTPGIHRNMDFRALFIQHGILTGKKALLRESIVFFYRILGPLIKCRALLIDERAFWQKRRLFQWKTGLFW